MTSEPIDFPFTLPCETPPTEYALVAAQHDPHVFDLIQQEDALARFHAVCIHWKYTYALAWLYKQKWDSKYKIPGWKKLRNETRQGIKALGEKLLSLLELCIQTHPLLKNPDYINATEWFVAIAWELKKEEVSNIGENLHSKSQFCAKHRNRLGQLKNYENPFSPSDSPHSYRLICEASRCSERLDQFRKKYWNPYRSAYSAWLKDATINQAWILPFEKEGKLFYHSKRNSTEYLYSPVP
jgi:hypothetical protein